MSSQYKVIQDNESSLLAIEIVDGEFDGMICSYGRVKFDPIENDERMKVSFDYSVMENKNDCDPDSQDLINFLGESLIEILDSKNNNIIENNEI